MQATSEHWYDRSVIKELVVKARDDGSIKFTSSQAFKRAAKGKETVRVWAPAEGDRADHPLFKLLQKARSLDLRLIWAARDVPHNFNDLPEFYEQEGSRHSDSAWAIECDWEMPSIEDALADILSNNPGAA